MVSSTPYDMGESLSTFLLKVIRQLQGSNLRGELPNGLAGRRLNHSAKLTKLCPVKGRANAESRTRFFLDSLPMRYVAKCNKPIRRNSVLTLDHC